MKRRTRKEDEASVDREEVARRAYELFVKRGRIPGRDQEDWLEAEEQLRRERKPKPGRKKAEAQLT
jgi:hypothetical protein